LKVYIAILNFLTITERLEYSAYVHIYIYLIHCIHTTCIHTKLLLFSS